jgi:hypothetical protein
MAILIYNMGGMDVLEARHIEGYKLLVKCKQEFKGGKRCRKKTLK